MHQAVAMVMYVLLHSVPLSKGDGAAAAAAAVCRVRPNGDAQTVSVGSQYRLVLAIFYFVAVFSFWPMRRL